MQRNPTAKKAAAALAATGLLSLAAGVPVASAAMSSSPCSPGTTMQQNKPCGAKGMGMNSKCKNPCAAKCASTTSMMDKKNPCAAKMKMPSSAG